MTMLDILIIGVGGMGRRHIRSLLRTQRCNVSCVDISWSNIDSAKRLFNLQECYGSLDHVPACRFGGVIVATPAHTHMEYARWCVRHKLPVLIEKPLAVIEDGVEALIEDVRGLGLVAGVAYPRRYSAGIREMKKRLAEGLIGELKLIHGTFSQDFRKYRPDYLNTYYARLETGGGALLDALSHHVNLVTHFAGPVQSVSAFYDRLVFENCEGEDTALINLRFQTGVLGSVQGNQFQKPNVDALELVGTKGNLRYERYSGKLSWNCSDAKVWESDSIDGDWDGILDCQAEEFLDVIENGLPLRTDLEDAFHTLRLILAAKQSQSTGRIISLQ